MLSKVHSAANFGLESIEVDIEVNIADKGFPGFTIVGINGKSGEEIKERVKTALINCDIEFPMAKVTINLAPADLAKEGTSYDLPIAVGILQSMGEINPLKEKSYFFGELSLDGSLRHTKGVFLLALLAKENGVRDIFVPRLSANEATVLDGVNIIPVDNLKNLIKHLRGEKLIEPLKKIESNQILGGTEVEFNFCEIFGQEQAKELWR
jgi:magnesium chelatase family protein